jgi:Outer membrane receptor for ferrienterochelin and colicins
MKKMKHYSRLTFAILIELGLSASLLSGSAWAAETSSKTTSSNASSPDASAMDGGTLMVTAQQQTLQAPGVSTITADEIKKHPPARDVSEIIRTMPGLT